MTTRKSSIRPMAPPATHKSVSKKSVHTKTPSPGIFGRLFGICFRRKTKKAKPLLNAADLRDLSGNFSEHTWDMDKIRVKHPYSNIDVHNPAKSKGLSIKLAEHVLALNGLNTLPEPKEVSALKLYLLQFSNLLWVMLITAATLSLVNFFLNPSEVINLYVTLILYAMIVVMCTLSWYQQMKARKVVSGFRKLLADSCQVLRDGKETTVNAKEVVLGDIILIKAGSRVPADVRIIQCTGLKLEASSITGESEPSDYQPEPVPEGVTIFDAHNVAFNGSLCVEGEGTAVVIRVASNTVIGQIAELTNAQSGAQKRSRLEEQVARYIHFLCIMILTTCSSVFLVGNLVNHWREPMYLLTNGFLVIATGMIPCGLPATVTSILTLIARKLSDKSVYLKQLDVVEALGQVGIIASDKTGTLTKNQMTVTDLWYHDEIVTGLPTSKPDAEGKKRVQNYESPVADILTCMAVCTSCRLPSQKTMIQRSRKRVIDESLVENGDVTDPNARNFTGTPSEVAIINYADRVVDITKISDAYDIVYELPFNSKRKWHLVISKMDTTDEGRCYEMMVKGAPEVLINLCGRILDSFGHEITIDGRVHHAFDTAYNHFASDGKRVIGFAKKTFVADEGIQFDMEKKNVPLEGLTFLGVCAIADPPREEAAEAVKLCRRAGIRVFMITGDHHVTATAIAKKIGLIEDAPARAQSSTDLKNLTVRGGLFAAGLSLIRNKSSIDIANSINLNKDYEVLHGERISKLSEDEWDRLLMKKALVFARTTPEQKLLIVEQCQKRKHLIGMTGDGVNDAPALKKADIGIAMGNGSEVAKQASDIILMDDNFSSIVKGVEEGRLMYENLKKLLGYTMPHTFAEAWPVILSFCFGFPMGITALQILSIDLGTEILPGVSMSKEPIEGDVMDRAPRKRSKGLISNALLVYSYLWPGQLECIGCFLSYLYIFHHHGIAVSDLWMSAIDSWRPGGSVFHSNGHAFSVDEQLYMLRQACSAWHMGIVFGQFFNTFCARTRRMSIFQHGLFSNPTMTAALVAEMILLLIFIYCPGINEFLGGAPIPWQCWAIVAVVGIINFVYNELRKLYIRRNPGSKFNRYIKW